MELAKKNISRTVVDTFYGQMYFPEMDDYKLAVAALAKPEDYEFWEFAKVNLIEDSANKTRFLIGDFNGNDEWYGLSMKLFLYNDGKCLGHIKYLTESKLADAKIEATFVDFKEKGFIIYGWWLAQGDQLNRESFIFFVERPGAKVKIAEVSPPPVSIKQQAKPRSVDSNVSKKAVSNRGEGKTTNKKKSAAKPATDKAREELDEELLVDGFVDLSANEERKASIHFLAYMLIKTGFQVQEGDVSMNFPDLILQRDDEYFFVHVFSSNKREGSWKVEVPKAQYAHTYIFCHSISKEFFPDIFITTGKEVTKWMKKNGRISTKDKELGNIKNLWGTLS